MLGLIVEEAREGRVGGERVEERGVGELRDRPVDAASGCGLLRLGGDEEGLVVVLRLQEALGLGGEAAGERLRRGPRRRAGRWCSAVARWLTA